jgi:S1-C subfamily serine protease
MVTDSGTFTAHCDYPMIESVDVGSPARKADLRAGDTVIAYNGRDVVALTVNYPQLLVPGKTIKVRVRRDGKSRELPVNVGERPVEFTDQTLRFVPGTMRTGPTARLGASGGNVFFERVAPMPPSGAATVVASAMSLMVMQGAQLTVVEDEFAQTQNMEPGILVLRVQPGTPAAEAGLRAGEMIRALNGTPVRELLPIKRMLGTPGIREVKLTVSGRETPVRILTLRW